MGDRYRYASGTGRRSPVYDSARASAPNVNTYYAGDISTPSTTRYITPIIQTQPVSSTHSHHHNRRNSVTQSDWRGPPVSVPITTTTYTVRKDPVTRTASVRDASRSRASTLDTKSRPPIIVTTRQAKDTSSTHDSGLYTPRRDGPAPDRGRVYRDNDYYAQPASSARSRSHTRPYTSGTVSSTLDNEELHRLRQRTNDGRVQSAWNEPRRERPTSFYAPVPQRQQSVSSDMGDSGYEYTKPSDLVRYDLDNDRRSNRDSYYRPSSAINDVDRRPYERSAKGPPPTTRGLDKVNRRQGFEDSSGGIYDRTSSLRVPAPVPVVVPLPVSDRRSSQLDVPPSPLPEGRRSRDGHRPDRPVSLYQEGSSRSSRVDDTFRESRAPRDRDYYRDESIGRRASILRTDGDRRKDTVVEDLGRDRHHRRESRLDDRDGDRESRLHSDEELERHRRRSRDYSRKEESPIRQERRVPKESSSRKEESSRDDDRDKDNFRDKVAAGIGLAAGAVGLGGILSHNKEEKEKEDKGSPKRREGEDTRRDDAEDRPKPAKRDHDERPRDNVEASEAPKKSRKDRDLEDQEDTDRNRRDAEARLNGDSNAKDHNDSSDEAKPRRRARPSSTAFKPNDTASLMALKEALKAQESDKESEKVASKDPSPERRTQRSPPREEDVDDPKASREDLRGREPMMTDDKQVRVLSPPRDKEDKEDKRPIKGILKQPRPQFPEEPNPVREGVAPHKDDKTKGSVPPGARWTKISRKLVNPDALTIGKERFEVRDDFVIVLRVLSKEEIEAYTAATAQLRGGLLPFHFPA